MPAIPYDRNNFNPVLPLNRKEVNAAMRHFYASNSAVRSAIDFHTMHSISGFKIECEDANVRQFFEEMNESISLADVIKGISHEYWKIGEVYPEAELSHETGVWTLMWLHNPDYIDIKPLVMLIPDEETKRIIRSPNPDDISIRSLVDPEVIRYVMAGQNIPLNSFNVSLIFNIESPYDRRGTSLIEPYIRDLYLSENPNFPYKDRIILNREIKHSLYAEEI